MLFNICFQVFQVEVRQTWNQLLKFAEIEYFVQPVWNQQIESFQECFNLTFYAFAQPLLAYFLHLVSFISVSDHYVTTIRY